MIKKVGGGITGIGFTPKGGQKTEGASTRLSTPKPQSAPRSNEPISLPASGKIQPQATVSLSPANVAGAIEARGGVTPQGLRSAPERTEFQTKVADKIQGEGRPVPRGLRASG